MAPHFRLLGPAAAAEFLGPIIGCQGVQHNWPLVHTLTARLSHLGLLARSQSVAHGPSKQLVLERFAQPRDGTGGKRLLARANFVVGGDKK